MNDHLFTSHFYGENLPTWPCPECGVQSLSCLNEQFHKSYKTPLDTNHPAFSPEWIEYIFTMHLECANASCGCRVVCVGTGDFSQEYLDDGSGNWDWFETFQVKFFQPPLKIFIPPENTPKWVKMALETSFSTFFSSPGSSLNALRSALEILLSELGVPTTEDDGKFLPLAKRINKLSDENRKIVDRANAIRWLGNDGTHSGGFLVQKNDVLDGYRIFEHILRELYPEKSEPIDDLVIRINQAKGSRRRV